MMTFNSARKSQKLKLFPIACILTLLTGGASLAATQGSALSLGSLLQSLGINLPLNLLNLPNLFNGPQVVKDFAGANADLTKLIESGIGLEYTKLKSRQIGEIAKQSAENAATTATFAANKDAQSLASLSTREVEQVNVTLSKELLTQQGVANAYLASNNATLAENLYVAKDFANEMKASTNLANAQASAYLSFSGDFTRKSLAINNNEPQ
jgi:hypothetical protein